MSRPLKKGHERDLETGNDYMHFRFFSASMGRFQKPDSNFDNPTSNPQGWNLYSYVKGNPVNFNDPTGHVARVEGKHGGGTPHPSWEGFDDMPDLEDYLWGGAKLAEEICYAVINGVKIPLVSTGTSLELITGSGDVERVAKAAGLTTAEVKQVLQYSETQLANGNMTGREKVEAVLAYAYKIAGSVEAGLLLVTWASVYNTGSMNKYFAFLSGNYTAGRQLLSKITSEAGLGFDVLHHITANAYNFLTQGSVSANFIYGLAQAVENEPCDRWANSAGRQWGLDMKAAGNYIPLSFYYPPLP